jgi:hypothetical protein
MINEATRRDAFKLMMTGANAGNAEIVYLDCLHFADGERDPAVACGMYRMLSYQFEMAHEKAET